MKHESINGNDSLRSRMENIRNKFILKSPNDTGSSMNRPLEPMRDDPEMETVELEIKQYEKQLKLLRHQRLALEIEEEKRRIEKRTNEDKRQTEQEKRRTEQEERQRIENENERLVLSFRLGKLYTLS